MKKIYFLLLLLGSSSFGQRADFFKEDLTFRLDGVFLSVEGYYWFANHSDRSVNCDIFYPLPDYAGAQFDSIQVYNISAGNQKIFKKEGSSGISFLLHLASLDTGLIQIKYRQKLTADSAVYILTSTKSWGKPITRAEFKLITPGSLMMIKFSYPPDKSYVLENLRIYYWQKENFMPDQELIFHF